MVIHGSRHWMRLLVCVALIFGISAALSSAQEKTKVAGKMTLTYSRQETIEVGDTEGHVLRLTELAGPNISTGEHKFMDNTQAVTMSFADLSQGSGHYQGYSRLSQGADTVFVKWQGEVTTTSSPEKNLLQHSTEPGSTQREPDSFRTLKGGGPSKERLHRTRYTSSNGKANTSSRSEEQTFAQLSLSGP